MTTTHYIPDITPPIPYIIIHSARRTLGLEVRDWESDGACAEPTAGAGN